MRHQSYGDIAGSGRSFSYFIRKAAAGWVLTGLILCAMFTAAARADDHIRAVRVSNVVGAVQIINGTETEFSQVYPNMPLMQGSTLKTGEDGRAEIQFEDGSMARLTPNTSATLTVLSRTTEGNTNTALDLKSGLAYIEMSGAANQRFVVHFLNSEVISPAPVKFRVNLDSNPPQFAVLDGSAHLSGAAAAYSVDVRANETIRFSASDTARYSVTQGIDGDSWDQWNTDRDQAMSQMAARETREARAGSNSGDPGWKDLDYYGNWYSANGSSFWAPNGAGAGWDPYGSGYWGYYGGGGGGYSWISGYPWGWLPYHCGSWNYYNSFGWGWAPGGCGAGWSPYVGVGSGPSGYRPVPRPQQIPSGGRFRTPGSRALIGVDRGSAATTLTPRTVGTPRPIAINGGTVRMLPKTPGTTSNNTFAARPVAVSGARPVLGAGGVQPVSVPVFRPLAPPSGARQTVGFSGARPMAPSSPSFGGRPIGGASVSAPRSVSQPAAGPRFGGSSGGPSMSAPRASAPAPSGGGGHVR